jgi:chorismate synthase
MGIQAVKGVEIGNGFALARTRGSEAHDEIEPDRRRATNRAGGIEGGITNGEPVVVRAAMKPLPTLMRPLRSVDPTGEPGTARRAKRRPGGGTGRRRRGRGRVELACAAREKPVVTRSPNFVGAHAAYLERIAAHSVLGRHLA